VREGDCERGRERERERRERERVCVSCMWEERDGTISESLSHTSLLR
jgi:hypothetical protein